MTNRSKATATPVGTSGVTEGWMADCTPFFEANRRTMDNWMKVNESVANSLFAICHEMLRFAQVRFQEDVETNVALARCRSPSDSFECQRRFIERATAQYHEAADKLSGLMSRMASETLSAVQRPETEGERKAQ